MNEWSGSIPGFIIKDVYGRFFIMVWCKGEKAVWMNSVGHLCKGGVYTALGQLSSGGAKEIS